MDNSIFNFSKIMKIKLISFWKKLQWNCACFIYFELFSLKTDTLMFLVVYKRGVVTSKLVIKNIMLQMPCNNHKILVWGEISKKKKKTIQRNKKSNATILHSTGRCIANKHGYFSVLNTNFQIFTIRNISQLFFKLLHGFYFCTCSIQSI